MDSFPAPLLLTPIDDSYNWRINAPFLCIDDALGTIQVPTGFVTDLGSVPRVFWNLLPPDGPAVRAYVVHDYLYARQTFTRKQSDDCLLRALMACHVGWLTRWTIYLGVRAGGGSAWASDAATTSNH